MTIFYLVYSLEESDNEINEEKYEKLELESKKQEANIESSEDEPKNKEDYLESEYDMNEYDAEPGMY